MASKISLYFNFRNGFRKNLRNFFNQEDSQNLGYFYDDYQVITVILKVLIYNNNRSITLNDDLVIFVHETEPTIKNYNYVLNSDVEVAILEGELF
ncbi:14499_t:CDS:2 [Gigaspora margarita]|uniref:14499_t:CDS:1 n=1 Tax=Gigaspora margarita TaxID=4874 RepID=A0ABN7UEN9_GIGMA|nr:14499_t:CDS:2 [Gigaspora margarita]